MSGNDVSHCWAKALTYQKQGSLPLSAMLIMETKDKSSLIAFVPQGKQNLENSPGPKADFI